MRVICSLCGEYQGEREPLTDKRETHGVCSVCHDLFLQQESLTREGVPFYTAEMPVIIVDKAGKVVALNHMTEELVGRTSQSALGMFGEKVMEYLYERLPREGGRSVHCRSCTFHNLVAETLRKRQGLARRTVRLVSVKESVAVLVSTEYVDDLVFIRLLR